VGSDRKASGAGAGADVSPGGVTPVTPAARPLTGASTCPAAACPWAWASPESRAAECQLACGQWHLKTQSPAWQASGGKGGGGGGGEGGGEWERVFSWGGQGKGQGQGRGGKAGGQRWHVLEEGGAVAEGQPSVGGDAVGGLGVSWNTALRSSQAWIRVCAHAECDACARALLPLHARLRRHPTPASTSRSGIHNPKPHILCCSRQQHPPDQGSVASLEVAPLCRSPSVPSQTPSLLPCSRCLLWVVAVLCRAPSLVGAPLSACDILLLTQSYLPWKCLQLPSPLSSLTDPFPAPRCMPLVVRVQGTFAAVVAALLSACDILLLTQSYLSLRMAFVPAKSVAYTQVHPEINPRLAPGISAGTPPSVLVNPRGPLVWLCWWYTHNPPLLDSSPPAWSPGLAVLAGVWLCWWGSGCGHQYHSHTPSVTGHRLSRCAGGGFHCAG